MIYASRNEIMPVKTGWPAIFRPFVCPLFRPDYKQSAIFKVSVRQKKNVSLLPHAEKN